MKFSGNILALSSLLTLASAMRPVVLWHAMGDRYDSPQVEYLSSGIKEAHPGIQVYPIRVAQDPEEDLEGSLGGNINEQVSKFSF